ncbi:DUF6557 family protein [Marinicellulosiphila megalodicopiae]|uniref:DUF6557 family protein n=1 Tax=Marinicellulosiphila megalodicopiae TaxID=2724896 RepID=UPI003BAFCB65
MKLNDLVAQYSWNDIEQPFIDYYGFYFKKHNKRIKKKRLNRFKSAYELLQTLKCHENHWRILVTSTLEDGENYVDVSSLNGELVKDQSHYNAQRDIEYAEDEVGFDITFTSWEQWLGMRIEKSSFDDFSNEEIVAHCLWEMTFNTFDNQIS